MTKSIKFISSLAIASVFAITPLFAQEDEAPTISPEALEAFGWAIAQDSPFVFNFTDEEFEHIMAGARKASQGEDLSAKVEEKMEEIQAFYMEKQMTYQSEMQARMTSEAETHRRAGAAYLAGLQSEEGIQQTESGLYYKIEDAGGEARAGMEDVVEIHYHGELLDGTVFDSSVERGETVIFPLGGVIPGFSEGLQLIGEGGKATLYIPAELGYGDQPAGNIPPGSTLKFDVELVRINPPQE